MEGREKIEIEGNGGRGEERWSGGVGGREEEEEREEEGVRGGGVKGGGLKGEEG